ncbi:MAG TPA: hypothetical protein VM432_12820 [Bdellovibrionales bacterium]|nr:hypothetical protein [Bdellovibrionales bacterium]
MTSKRAQTHWAILPLAILFACSQLISANSFAQDPEDELFGSNETAAPSPTPTPQPEAESNEDLSEADAAAADEQAIAIPDKKPDTIPAPSEAAQREMYPPATAAEKEEFELPDEAPTPVPNSKALQESGLSNPSGSGEYRRPLLFAPEDNKLKLTSPQIKWTMLRGSRINLGGLKIDSSDIAIVLGSRMSFRWPEALSRIGTVSIETLDGKRVWSKAVATEARKKWAHILEDAAPDEISPHAKSQWGLDDIDAQTFRFLGNGTNYRMCLSRKNSRLQRLKVCTHAFTARKMGDSYKMTMVPSDLPANVYYQGKPISEKGLLNFPPKREILLKIVFENGSFIEIASQPMNLKLLDVVESKDAREVILTGSGELPLGKKKIISQPETHFWSATGIEQEVIWQIAIPTEAPTVRVLGAFNLPFTYLFRYDRLPRESDRVFIRERASTGAFSSKPILYGYTPNASRISSKEATAKRTDAKHFEWTFAAPVRGKENRSRLFVVNPKDKTDYWVAHHSVYRGYSFEASTRLTGVATEGAYTFLGEVAASAWFEDLGLARWDWLARQRWGLTGRYFRALQPFDQKSSDGSKFTVSQFSAWNVDLKYNILRGVWNRDELFGLIGSVEGLTVHEANATLGGVGIYWARTMPRIFNQAIELLPYFDYSKYVDVEFIYYPVALSGNTIAGQSWNLNFHGKVFWTKRVYGEAGFGFKQFDFADKTNNRTSSIGMSYGTVGLGTIF